jgi:predicted O-methyltransferase YrrM
MHLRDLAGKPMAFLEVGVYEAGSAAWLLENVLQHPESSYTGIDPYRSFRRKREEAIARLRPFGERVRLILRPSFDVLPTLPPATFDVIHVDGDHAPLAAFADMVLAWRLLKPGGLLACDDLMHEKRPVVKPAFDAFRLTVPDAAVLEDARQGWLQKP